MRVEISYYTAASNTLEGRLLGYIDSEQFKKIMAEPKILAKCVNTGRTEPLKNVRNCEGKRLVFSVLTNKLIPKLLITEKIESVDEAKYLRGEIIELSLSGMNYGWMSIYPI